MEKRGSEGKELAPSEGNDISLWRDSERGG